ncbi:response regulator transcription factor [Roseateles sp. DAIF2]|uniref:response regulator transcription factor n=1 Tax=Roseateles sp. DAIF2 TaxID=2714952 RepID=UPI0018A26E5F|nr:response regulator transcription factor [Roseateles sp. DAIF2]QPF73640.1 response regulator transcription factor [Roseateles sp. DAIF2]
MRDVILLEDEAVLREELSEFLAGCGYRVDAESSLEGFQRRYDPTRHGIALIDLGLPDGDGLTLIQQLRARGDRLGIVVLTARGATRDRVAGLDIGADYYLAKTSDLDELAATLSALSRRLGDGGGAPQPNAAWVLELSPRRLLPPGFGPIALSEQDLIVLHELMRGAGQIASRQQIVEALGEDFLSYDQRRLDTQMRRLRRKVNEATGLALPINTARNAGYRFHARALIRP